MTTIFLDLDGVLADFDGAFPARFGVSHIGMNKKEMWNYIKTDQDFFFNMPMMPDAEMLYGVLRGCYNNPLHILTACPASDYHHVAAQKRAWVKENIAQDVLVLPTWGSEGKPAFMHSPGDILIDDWGKNCEAWESAGGRAIKHENAETTIRTLRKMMNEHSRFV